MSEFKSIVSKLTKTQKQYWKALQREFGAGDLPVLICLKDCVSSTREIFRKLRNLGLIETEQRGYRGVELIWVCQGEQDWRTHVKRRDALALQLPIEKRQGILELGVAEILFWMELRRMAEKQPLPFTFSPNKTSNPASGHACLYKLRQAGLIETTKAGMYGVWLLWICDTGDFWKLAVPQTFKYASRLCSRIEPATQTFKIVPAVMRPGASSSRLHQLESLTPEQWERYQQIVNPHGQRLSA